MSVKVAMVGCGSIAIKAHVPALAANPGAQLVAFCDIVESRARDLADQHGGKTYENFESLLKHPDLDAVVLGVPNFLHAPMTIAALRAGKHVLVEKPMATTRDEARAMIRSAEQASRILMIGQSQRYDFSHILARQIIRSGQLGRVLSFRTCFAHRGPEHWCADKSASTWFFDKTQAAMGVCGDLAIHKVDIMRFILDEEITHVQAEIATRHKRYTDGRLIDVDDNALLNVRTTSGVVGNIMVAWTNYGDHSAYGTSIYCENGVLLLNASSDAQLLVRFADGTEQRHVTARTVNGQRVNSIPVTEAFVEAIAQRKPSPIDGHEGFRSLQVVLAAFESNRTGNRIAVDVDVGR